MLVAMLSLISCTTTREIKLSVPDFPTLENVEDMKEHPTFWEIEKNYFTKIMNYIADCEKVFEEMKMLKLTD